MSDDKGSVYLAVNKSMPGLVKIGMTTGDVRSRMKELSADTGVPTPFTCPYSCEVQNPAIIEKQLHEHYDYCRENNKREFFRADWRAVRITLRSAGILSESDNESSLKVGKFTVIKWAKEGNVKNVRQALAEGGDPNQKDDDKITALMWAAELGHTDIVKFLFEKEADPTRTNTYGQSALFNAGNGVIAKMLLDKGADPNTTDRNNNSPLTHAVQKSRADVVEVLLNVGANPGYNLDSAVRQDNIEIVKMLLAKGANPKPHLDNAVRQDNIKIVKILLEEGADPKPHLYKAVTEGRVKIVKMLLAKGADPKLHLDSAVRWGKVEIVKILLEEGADPKPHLDAALKEGNIEIIKMFISKGVDRDECLALAAIGNNFSVVKELLATNTNATNACKIVLQKDHPDANLWWVLEQEALAAMSDKLSAKKDCPDADKLMLKNNVNPGGGMERITALMQENIAERWKHFTATMNKNRAEKDHPDAVRFMLGYNADPWGCFTAIVDKNRADMASMLLKSGLNPKDALEYTANVGHVSVVKALLDNHAYPQANMTSSLLLAIKKRRLDVVSLLASSGADPDVGVASAIRCNDISVILTLLVEGADPDKVIGWAVRSNYADQVKYLLHLGADPWVGLKAAKNHKVNADIKWMLRKRAFLRFFED